MPIRWHRYSGTGNTFVLLDARQVRQVSWAEEARALTERHQTDGLLVMETGSRAPVRMRIFNRDGSEAEMCGNGSRCAAHWARAHAGLPASFEMETQAGLLKAWVDGDEVKVRLTNPSVIEEINDLKVPGLTAAHYFVNTGVPHLVSVCRDLDSLAVQQYGSAIRYHERFRPAGTNASFLERLSGDEIACRVYERGVEAETLSCGTGATACALVAAFKFRTVSPVKVRVRTGELLRVHFEKTADERIFREVALEGKVEHLAEGESLNEKN